MDLSCPDKETIWLRADHWPSVTAAAETGAVTSKYQNSENMNSDVFQTRVVQHARNKSGDMMMLWWEVLQRLKMLNWELLWHMGHLRARTRITTDLREGKVQVFTSRGLRLNSTSIQSFYFLVWCFFKLVSITVFLSLVWRNWNFYYWHKKLQYFTLIFNLLRVHVRHNGRFIS